MARRLVPFHRQIVAQVATVAFPNAMAEPSVTRCDGRLHEDRAHFCFLAPLVRLGLCAEAVVNLVRQVSYRHVRHDDLRCDGRVTTTMASRRHAFKSDRLIAFQKRAEGRTWPIPGQARDRTLVVPLVLPEAFLRRSPCGPAGRAACLEHEKRTILLSRFALGVAPIAFGFSGSLVFDDA